MNRTRLLLTITLGLTFSIAIAAADPIESERLLDAVNYVQGVDNGTLRNFDPDEEVLGTDRCLEEVAGVLVSHKPSTLVNLRHTKIPGATASGDKWTAPISAIEKYCADVAVRAVVHVGLAGLEETLTHAAQLHQEYFVDGGDPADNWYNLEAVAKKCPAAVDAALAKGIPASQRLELGGKLTAITLGQAKADVCGPLVAAVGKVQAQQRAAEEARLAPFKKSLKGDKLALVLSRGTDWYGKGCRLMSVAQMAKATTWYEILVDTSGIQARWTTRAYKFKGDKRAGNKERSGWGNDAPSSGCP